MERLQRVMAARGAGSRRAAEELIRAGRVSVDGKTVTELGTKVDPNTVRIRVDGQLLRAQRPRSILLNKPSGYITTTSDERGRWTVMDLVDVPERVYPVGRLDRDTEGLLLLTNDGDIANRVMHPRYGLDKEYHILTLSRPDDRTLSRVRDGVIVEGRRIVPSEFRILRETREGLILRIVIHEGLFHVVRRMMETVGIPVERLRRVRVGPLSVEGIPKGTWRDLTAGELAQLHQALRLDEAEPEEAPVRVGRRAQRRRAALTAEQAVKRADIKAREEPIRPQRPAPPPTPAWRRAPSTNRPEQPSRGTAGASGGRRPIERSQDRRSVARPGRAENREDPRAPEGPGRRAAGRAGGGRVDRAPARDGIDQRKTGQADPAAPPSGSRGRPEREGRVRRKGEPPAPAKRWRDERPPYGQGPGNARRPSGGRRQEEPDQPSRRSWQERSSGDRNERPPMKGRGAGQPRSRPYQPRREAFDQEAPGQHGEFDPETHSNHDAGPPPGRRHRRSGRGGQDDRGPAARRPPRRDPV